MKASIILPVHNGESTLSRQLHALMAQSFAQEYEVLVINNRSIDRSLDIANRAAEKSHKVRAFDAPEAGGISEAINFGVTKARSTNLLTTDQDDWVDPSWVSAMVTKLEDFSIVSGSTTLQFEPLSVQHFEAKNFRAELLVHGGFRPFAMNCNMAFTRPLFDALGGFDPTMDQAQDIDFSWRAQRLGFQLGLAEEAKLVKSLRTSSKGRFFQHIGYGRADYALQMRFHDFGYQGIRRNALRKLAWTVVNSHRALGGSDERSHLAAVAGSALGALLPHATKKV